MGKGWFSLTNVVVEIYASIAALPKILDAIFSSIWNRGYASFCFCGIGSILPSFFYFPWFFFLDQSLMTLSHC